MILVHLCPVSLAAQDTEAQAHPCGKPSVERARDAEAAAWVTNADEARGGGIPGLVWNIHASSTGAAGDDPIPDYRLRVKAAREASLAEILEPANSKGNKMLQVDRNMWMTKPNLRKPVAISPRMRLTGQAAIGDIAATHYAQDYAATFLRDEPCGEEQCHVLDLSARHKRTTYDRITYWVSVARGVAVKADFLSPSCKPIKSARFEYANVVNLGGKKIAFVSMMHITDAASDARTTLRYSDIEVREIPASEFDVANLQ
ncbi:MAG: outer membrane lipoprotein-sorting protein [Azoarcus sp.]|nr:outer membrane lipoprotein-sorting protein [Azoarcus sp.]